MQLGLGQADTLAAESGGDPRPLVVSKGNHWHPTEPNRERNSLGNSLVNSAGRANDFWSIKY